MHLTCDVLEIIWLSVRKAISTLFRFNFLQNFNLIDSVSKPFLLSQKKKQSVITTNWKQFFPSLSETWPKCYRDRLTIMVMIITRWRAGDNWLSEIVIVQFRSIRILWQLETTATSTAFRFFFEDATLTQLNKKKLTKSANFLPFQTPLNVHTKSAFFTPHQRHQRPLLSDRQNCCTSPHLPCSAPWRYATPRCSRVYSLALLAAHCTILTPEPPMMVCWSEVFRLHCGNGL